MKINGDKLQDLVIDGLESAKRGFITSYYLVGKTKSNTQIHLIVTRDPDLLMNEEESADDICITGI